METSIVKQIMSDGSYVYNVEVTDGLRRIVIAAISENAAERIQNALADDAVSVGVY